MPLLEQQGAVRIKRSRNDIINRLPDAFDGLWELTTSKDFIDSLCTILTNSRLSFPVTNYVINGLVALARERRDSFTGEQHKDFFENAVPRLQHAKDRMPDGWQKNYDYRLEFLGHLKG